MKHDDECPCGRAAYEAIGDPMQDHESNCLIHRHARLLRALKNLAEWGDGAGLESARAYARATLNDEGEA